MLLALQGGAYDAFVFLALDGVEEHDAGLHSEDAFDVAHVRAVVGLGFDTSERICFHVLACDSYTRL